MPDIVHSFPLAEDILESHRDRAHGDDAGYDAYKAHVYRVVNFARALTPDQPDRDDKLVIAVAFHDLSAFETLDYLVPSIKAQDRVIPVGILQAVRNLQQPGFLRFNDALKRSGHAQAG
jgi:hypothetical protein